MYLTIRLGGFSYIFERNSQRSCKGKYDPSFIESIGVVIQGKSRETIQINRLTAQQFKREKKRDSFRRNIIRASAELKYHWNHRSGTVVGSPGTENHDDGDATTILDRNEMFRNILSLVSHHWLERLLSGLLIILQRSRKLMV